MSDRRRIWAFAVAASALAALVGTACMAWVVSTGATSVSAGRPLPWSTAATLVPLAALVIDLAAFGAFACRPSKLFSATLAVAVLFDMGVGACFADWSWACARENRLFSGPPELDPYRKRLDQTGQRMTGVPSHPFTPIDAAPPNLNALWRLPTTSGFHPLVPQRTGQMLDTDGMNLFSPRLLTADDRALDILASRYLLVPSQLLDPKHPAFNTEIANHLADSARFVPAGKLNESVAFENLRAMPRCWLASEVRLLSANEILAAVRTSVLPDGAAFDPARMALVEEPCDLLPVDSGSTPRLTPKRLSHDAVEVRVESSNPALCVASDINYPGWGATIDGAPARLFTTDFLLMGTLVPPGTHTVRFQYAPNRFYWGAAVSALALLVTVGLAVGEGVRLRRLGRMPAFMPPPTEPTRPSWRSSPC
jgi:hypothetical protein